jgi:hypothetical protein
VKNFSRPALWIAITVGSIVELGRIIAEADRAEATGSYLVVLALGVAVVLSVLFLTIDLINIHRQREVARNLPNALLFSFIAYDEFGPQHARVSELACLPLNRITTGTTSVAAIDSEMVRFFRGVSGPQMYLAVPTSLVRSVSISKVSQGKWNLKTIEIAFGNPPSLAVVNLCVIRDGLSIPTVRRKRDLEALLTEIRTALSLEPLI